MPCRLGQVFSSDLSGSPGSMRIMITPEPFEPNVEPFVSLEEAVAAAGRRAAPPGPGAGAGAAAVPGQAAAHAPRPNVHWAAGAAPRAAASPAAAAPAPAVPAPAVGQPVGGNIAVPAAPSSRLSHIEHLFSRTPAAERANLELQGQGGAHPCWPRVSVCRAWPPDPLSLHACVIFLLTARSLLAPEQRSSR